MAIQRTTTGPVTFYNEFHSLDTDSTLSVELSVDNAGFCSVSSLEVRRLNLSSIENFVKLDFELIDHVEPRRKLAPAIDVESVVCHARIHRTASKSLPSVSSSVSGTFASHGLPAMTFSRN